MNSNLQISDIYTSANLVVIEDDIERNLLLESFVKELKKENNLNYLFFVEDEDSGKNLKLEEVFAIRNFFVSYSSHKRYVFVNKNLRSTVTQNALLKILEELKPNDYIVIFANSLNVFLPTILSRVAILKPQNHVNDNNYKDIKSSLIRKHDWIKLENILKLENEYKRGLISEKQWKDLTDML